MESAIEQNDYSSISKKRIASLELRNNVGSSEVEHFTAEAADPEAEGTDGAVEQDENSPASDHQDDLDNTDEVLIGHVGTVGTVG